MQVQTDQLFRMLPQIGEVLERPPLLALQRDYSRKLVVESLRSALDDLRNEVKDGLHSESSLETELLRLEQNVARRLRLVTQTSLRRVINATGVILQTNLGRAPLSAAAVQQMSEIASGYSNLELDLKTGERGHRDMHVRQLILDVLALKSNLTHDAFADKDATVVNNCAAACFLALNSLAEGGEVIVSRGELVEIGGGFRVPEILLKSGAVLREVGTTNRTRLADYKSAINPATKLILRVHLSNFRMEGFTERPDLEELRDLGRRASVPVFEDQGSGAVVDLQQFGIEGEHSFLRSVTSGIDLVACSGDKLLGGPQCGILVGTKSLIEKANRNPLFRAMRVDKLTYATLEQTLLAYLLGMEESLPLVQMMRTSPDTILKRCLVIADTVRSTGVLVDIVETRSVVGGGTTPGDSLPSFALSLRHLLQSESAFAERLRELTPPVMVRTNEGRVLLDLRTVQPFEDELLSSVLVQAIKCADGIREAEEQS